MLHCVDHLLEMRPSCSSQSHSHGESFILPRTACADQQWTYKSWQTAAAILGICLTSVSLRR